MLELKDEPAVSICRTCPTWRWKACGSIIDGAEPNWLATGRRGARLLEWLREPLTVGALSRRYAEWLQLDAARSWLHVHSFVRDCLRRGMVSFTPVERAPYAGRSAHLSLDKLSEGLDPHQQFLQSLLHPLPGQFVSGSRSGTPYALNCSTSSTRRASAGWSGSTSPEESPSRVPMSSS